MKINQVFQGEIAVLMLSGRFLGGIDHDHFMERIKSLVAEGHVDLLLDMTELQYVDSTGVGSIFAGWTTLKKNSGRLKICSIPSRVDNVLEYTKINLLLDTYETSAEALASFGK